jgi:AcrR family transcriptional regulator
MPKKTDLRVIRTRKNINEAFLKLIQQKGFDSVTIQDIANEALINRATFYLHYEDKFDLLKKMSNTIIEELMNSINPAYHIEDKEVKIKKLQSTIENVYECVSKNHTFFKVMFGEHGVYNFRNDLEEMVRNKFSKNMTDLGVHPSDFEIPKDLIVHFICSAFVGVIQWWLKEDMNPSPREMSLQLSKIVTMGPMQAAGIKVGKMFE